MTQLGACLDRVETWNPLRAAPSDEFCYIDLSAVDQDSKQIIGARRITCSEAPSRARQSVASGDLLMSTVRPNLNGVARVTDELDGATASTGFCVLRANPGKLDKNYLFQWIKSSDFISDMVSKATGASYPAVSDRIIFESKIPLPPLSEQRRIAAILDQAETLRTQRRTALALLDTLTQSIFLDMFGDPVTNPKSWQQVSLDEAATIERNTVEANKITSGTLYVGLENIMSGGGFNKVSQVMRGDLASNKFRFTQKHLLYGKLRPYLAKIAKPHFDGICSTDILPVLPGPNTERDFLSTLFLLPIFVERANSLATGANLPRLSPRALAAFTIPLPPLPLQQTFATRIQAIEALKSTHRTALAQLDALFASLQHRAFSGELTRPGAAALQALSTPQQSFTDLPQLDPEKGLEALIYVCRRTSGFDFYKSQKTLYFADRHHLGHHGRLIYGETYNALPMGPVPQAAYDAAKLLIGEAMFSPFDDDALRAALRRTDKQLIALRDADFSKFSAAERASLDYAIRYCADMSFEQVKTASHDSAYVKTPANAPIAMQDLIASLPDKAQQQFFSDYA